MELPMDLRSSRRRRLLALPPDDVWSVVACGARGERWYVDAAPFAFRSAVDRLVGGHGRCWPPPGRPLLREGDRAGFWVVRRADAAGPERRLVLEADVRAPGVVTLTVGVSAAPDGASRLELVVTFAPDGLLGRAYLLADLPARETLVTLVHRRLCHDVLAPSATGDRGLLSPARRRHRTGRRTP